MAFSRVILRIGGRVSYFCGFLFTIFVSTNKSTYRNGSYCQGITTSYNWTFKKINSSLTRYTNYDGNIYHLDQCFSAFFYSCPPPFWLMIFMAPPPNRLLSQKIHFTISKTNKQWIFLHLSFKTARFKWNKLLFQQKKFWPSLHMQILKVLLNKNKNSEVIQKIEN